jgi:hypothetical protein
MADFGGCAEIAHFWLRLRDSATGGCREVTGLGTGRGRDGNTLRRGSCNEGQWFSVRTTGPAVTKPTS